MTNRIFIDKLYCKLRTVVDLRRHINHAVHHFYISGYDMQPQARALNIGDIGSPKEAFEQVLPVFGRYAHSPVFDCNYGIRTHAGCRDGYGGTLGRKLDGVRHQVHHDVFQQRRIHKDHGSARVLVGNGLPFLQYGVQFSKEGIAKVGNVEFGIADLDFAFFDFAH